MTEAELLKTPCEICCRPDDISGCGFNFEILFEQWDATCKLIRERTGKKK